LENIEQEIDKAIEKKFRNLRLEYKAISYLIRKNYNPINSLSRNFFTIEPLQVFFDIVSKNQITFPKDIFWQYVKKNVGRDQHDIFKNYVKKVFKEPVTDIDKKSFDSLKFELGKLLESRVIMKATGDMIYDLENFNVDIAKRKYREAAAFSANYDILERGDILGNFENRKIALKRIQDNPSLGGVKTGIRRVDDLSGGIMPGELGILIAPSGIGKTFLLGNLALNAWKEGKNVVFISLEMGLNELQYRFDSRITKILYSKFRKAELTKKEFDDWTKKIDWLKKRKKNFFEVVCLPRKCSANEVEEKLVEIQNETGQETDLLIIDYLNLMVDNKSKYDSNKKWESQADVAWDIKEFIRTFNGKGIPCWTANQLTDEGTTAKKILGKHIKYARATLEVANFVFGLNQGTDEELEDILNLWLVKCRGAQKTKKPIILHPRFDVMTLNQPKVKSLETKNEN
jgi:archaellum biogenesis ATPase FlaH